MDDESELTSETNQDEAPVDGDSFDDPSDNTQPEATGQETEETVVADADATADTSQADVSAAEADAIDQESAAPTEGNDPSPDDAPPESQDETENAGQQPAEAEPAAGRDGPLSSSLSESEESDTMLDEGQDTSDSNRIRYETGEIADQTQNVTSKPGITEEMLNTEPQEGAVTIETDVAGEEAAEEPPDAEAAAEATVDDNETVATEERDADEEQPSVVVEPDDSKPDADGQGAELGNEESPVDDRFDVHDDDVVTVSVMRVEEPDDPLDPDLMNLPTRESDALLPIEPLKKQSSWLARDIVAPSLLAMTQSGSTVAEREAFADQMAKEADLEADGADDGKEKVNEDEGEILAQYLDDMEPESSEGTEGETTGSESSSASQETLKDEDAPGGKDNVFDWLRRVSTQMDEMGITEQLKEMYGDDIVKPIVMAPAEEEDEESDVPEELPDMVSPKMTHSDTGMYHESSLSLDTTYRVRQSSTQTDVKEDDRTGGADAGRKGRPKAARQKPCGSCPCCLAMKRVVSRGEGTAETDGVRRRPAPSKEQQQQQQEKPRRPWTSPARSVGDLLDNASSTTASSSCTTSSVDGGDSYERRMKHPKRWLKQATDEFMRRECIRQVVLKNDLVSDGRIQTKVTRISRHPNSLTDCLAATRSRASAGQSLQMEISKGETVVGGRTVNYQDVKIRTPKSCSGLSVRSAPRTRSSRPAPEDDDVSKRFIDTYLAQSQAGLHPGRSSRNGRESKTRKKITIKTDCRK